MIDPLHWCKPSFSLCEEPHCELEQTSQLEEEKYRELEGHVINTFTPISMNHLIFIYATNEQMKKNEGLQPDKQILPSWYYFSP